MTSAREHPRPGRASGSWTDRWRRAVSDLALAAVLARATVRSMAEQPRTLVLRTLGASLVVGIEVTGAAVLCGRFNGIAGWSTAEVAWLVGIANAGLGVAMVLADSLEPPTLAQTMRDGRLDAALTKPLAPLLHVMATDLQIRHLGRFVAGTVVVVGSGIAADVAPTPANLALAVGAIAACGAVVTAVLVIGGAVTIWTREGTELVNAFTFGGAMLASFPITIFAPQLRFAFVWVVPLGAAVYVPSAIVFGRAPDAGVGAVLWATPLLVVAISAAAAAAWRAALRSYVGGGG